jgi:hypothetical protein
MLFAGLYLESNATLENQFVREFFEIEIKMDVLLLRMVLDIVAKMLKQIELSHDAYEKSDFLNSSQRFDRDSILDALDQVENENID